MMQWACTSIVFTRRPFTTTSRRRAAGLAAAEPPAAAACAASCAAAMRLQPVNTTPGMMPAARALTWFWMITCSSLGEWGCECPQLLYAIALVGGVRKRHDRAPTRGTAHGL